MSRACVQRCLLFPRSRSIPIVALILSAVSAQARAQTEGPDSTNVGPNKADTAPTNSAPPAGTSSDQAAADEAAALAATLATATNDVTGDQKLHLYGFADFTYTQPVETNGLFYPYGSFAVGHLNVYLGSDLGDDWRWLSEVRFMYLPNGSIPSSQAFTGGTPIDTAVTDYTDFRRPVRWGGISIERAWLERTVHPLLTIRLGQFLSPYGIWNVDHGSPVIIPVTRPYAVGEELIPQRQTGIELYGTWNLGATQLGYHLTLSNGRGPIDTYQDLDHNKAVGGRLFVRHDSSFGMVTLGASGYRGQYSERHAQGGPDASGKLVINYPLDVQYNELSLAADVKWEWGGLLVQGEAMVNDVGYTNGARPVDRFQPVIGGPPGFVADYRRYGYYALLGYRTPLWGIMPFVFAEDYRNGPQGTSIAAVRGGLNIRSTPRVVLKAEWLHVWFHDSPPGLFRPSNEVIFQAAWSF